MFECGKSGRTAMFKNFSTQPLCNIWVDGHEVRDICQYAGCLSDGYELWVNTINEVPTVSRAASSMLNNWSRISTGSNQRICCRSCDIFKKKKEVLPSVLSAKCCKKLLSAMGLATSISANLRLSVKACCTSGSNHSLMIFECSSFLSLNNSNSGQIEPRRPRLVTFCWADSNACMKEPQVSSVADPLGPIGVPGTGSEADNVSRVLPNRNSDAASRVKR